MSANANIVISPLSEIQRWKQREIDSFIERLEVGLRWHLPGLSFDCKEEVRAEIEKAVQGTGEAMILDSLNDDDLSNPYGG